MLTTTLVTDSTSYLPPGLAEQLGVVVVPLHVVLDGEDLAELDVDPADLDRRLRAGASASTSQPPPGAFLQAFEAAPTDRVLCLTATATMSGTHSSATLAAGMSGKQVDVVDSGTISGGLCLVALEVARAVQDGASHDEAVALARSLAGRISSVWSSDTTALLTAGGRAAEELPEGIPVLALEGGAVRVVGAARSVTEAVTLQARVVRAAAAASATAVTVGHGDVPEIAEALEVALDGEPGVLRVDRYVVGPVVGAHAGAGNVGASWLGPDVGGAP